MNPEYIQPSLTRRRSSLNADPAFKRRAKLKRRYASKQNAPVPTMTPEALRHIQSICREWLQQSGSQGLNLTILPSGPLVQTIEVQLQSFMTPDGTTITTAVDVETGAKYVAVVRKLGMDELVIETPLEKIPRPIDDRLLPPGDPPPPEWKHVSHFASEPEPDPVNDTFPLIQVGDRVFVMDGWDLEERGYGVVKDIWPHTSPYPTYLVELDGGKESRETRYDLFLISDE